jgi:hypothetical protein
MNPKEHPIAREKLFTRLEARLSAPDSQGDVYALTIESREM